MLIATDDPRRPDVAALLEEHIASMRSISPPESKHALDLEGLCAAHITFCTARDRGELLGCGAVADLGDAHGEIKSMRTASSHLRKGVAAALLTHLLGLAAQRGMTRVSLETGAQPAFAPARALYTRFGFIPCGPFGTYQDDPNSVFMTRMLNAPSSPA
jgi:putative acetyltransferase